MSDVRLLLPILCFVVLTACTSTTKDRVLDANTGKGQVELRQIQSRSFDTNQRERTMRAVIATLQDLSFVVDKADLDLGTVSGTKLDGYAVRMTVSVRSRNKSQLLVRASAQFNDKPILEPKPYQDFFNSLSKALFLEANAVE